jgi:hypothetical protein
MVADDRPGSAHPAQHLKVPAALTQEGGGPQPGPSPSPSPSRVPPCRAVKTSSSRSRAGWGGAGRGSVRFAPAVLRICSM